MADRPGDDFHVYDTTLRDGAQREGISYSVADKLAVARLLDELGVGFIEGGWPGAMPKDTEFFARARDELDLRRAQLVAFGATRKAGVAVDDDAQVRALVESGAPVVTVVAKSDVVHVREALRTTEEENLAMVTDTVAYLVAQGRRVFVDCEHFFDGFARDNAYGVALLDAAAAAGASVGVLCDTNGGMLPLGLAAVVEDVRSRTSLRLGIHCQDDTACAVANTVAAVGAGATHVQCTANGYGERTGNADLFAVVANLETKLGLQVLPEGGLREMVRVSHAIAEIANLVPNTHQAYVGVSAFAHKAGLHASALKVSADLYNHVDPTVVGNDMRVLVTEMAGRASVELKGRELGFDLDKQPGLVAEVTARVKDLEACGYTFEAADASFELLLHEVAEGSRPRFWDVESWRAIVESKPAGGFAPVAPAGAGAAGAPGVAGAAGAAGAAGVAGVAGAAGMAGAAPEQASAEATVKVRAGGRRVVAVGEGNGPVNALDQALRAAVGQLYPAIERLELIDYKVRITDASHGTDAMTRVLVETSDGSGSWVTVGVGNNVVEASWEALTDGLTYGLLRQGQAPHAET